MRRVQTVLQATAVVRWCGGDGDGDGVVCNWPLRADCRSSV